MKKLLDYLNGLPIDEREAFAARCHTTFDYLRQIGYGNRTCREALASELEIETNGAVTRKDFFPDDWPRIWPELAGKPGRRRSTNPAP